MFTEEYEIELKNEDIFLTGYIDESNDPYIYFDEYDEYDERIFYNG